jgi:hypothetical protein
VDATFLNLSQSVWGQTLESDLVISGKIESFNVLQRAGGKEEPVIAEEALGS